MSTVKRNIPSARRGPWPSPSAVSRISDLSLPHVASFDYALSSGLATAVADIPAREIRVSSGDVMQLWLEDVVVGHPTSSSTLSSDSRLLPSECRQRGLTYAAAMHGTVCKRINGGAVDKIRLKLGEVPIMVRSSHCHLRGLSPAECVAVGEEAVEFGGYFICNGIERIVRMLQIPKRNYPHAITRSAYTNRGPLYSNKGIVMRCVKPDQTGVTLTLHYLTDGSATVRFSLNRQEFFLPVIMVLKSLVHTTDREIYERVLAGDSTNTYLSDRVLMLLRDAKRYESALHSREAALAYIGARFRGILDMPPSLTDIEAGQTLIDRFILVHLPQDAYRDKFNLLILMLRKLYGFIRGDVQEDNPDCLANQELLLTGHLLLMFLKEKLGDFLAGIEEMVRRDDTYAARVASGAVIAKGSKGSAVAPPNLHDATYVRKIIDRQPDVGKKLYYLLATGNLVTKSGLDLMQVSGYTVVADKTNFIRFTTHFRSVHRGQFFAEQKTTTVRKLLPENWGFLCPVHTPDGAPCGLLNHLSSYASVTSFPLSETSYSECADRLAATKAPVSGPHSFASDLNTFLVSLGMTPYAATNTVLPYCDVPILLDGRLLGGAPPHTAYKISRALRRAKAITSGVRAGLSRVAGALPLESQHQDVCNLMRTAVLGLTDPRSARKREKVAAGQDTVSFSPAMALPPSLEVAFVPPPWWDSAVDPELSLEEGQTLAKELDAANDVSSSKSEDHPKLVGLFSGLFLHTTPARLLRPVIQLDTGLVELLAPLEQPYVDIACTPDDLEDILHLKCSSSDGKNEPTAKMLYTHIELSASSMLSEVAALTPFSDLNQSPRNMYQCQMGKQTMGTPLHSWSHRTDTKLFRLQNPQAPIVQSQAQAEFGFDEYPNGCNAIVAVIAYTGYDMEDACIVNKASYERGFGHASVYKTHEFDLNEGKSMADIGRYCFHNTYVKGENAYKDITLTAAKAELLGVAPGAAPPKFPTPGEKIAANLDEDGLPAVGSLIKYEDPIYVVYDTTLKTHKIARHKELEPVYVDEVRILGPTTSERGGAAVQAGLQKVSIKVRYNRNPVVGDKFSSRHGQKGVLSFLWPQQDMPFTDSGIVPDVIINPHAFPSRMTIGMLIESMAGKAGACYGRFQDATPFQFDEKNRVVDYFGEQLRSAGYNYYGTETMYSGVTGEPLHCQIYLGVVYYQRLRHMVNDKSQVRSTGPINQLTRQPVKGRKKHGGIRFGEMERDSLLAHGASFLLRDRLHNSSDRHLAIVCNKCGSMLSTYAVPAAATTLEQVPGEHLKTSYVSFGSAGTGADAALNRGVRGRRAPYCRVCETGEHCALVPMPYVFRYLVNELAAMNIKIQLELGPGPYASVHPSQ